MAQSASWDKWSTTPTPTQARAYLGTGDVGVTFPFNPDTVSWDYSENIFSQDTLGGRVVQLLSVSLNGMTMTGRAGSRKELQKMANAFKGIMEFHVRTLEPVYFKVPSREWSFSVYLQAVPQLSWDVTATSYPYQLQFLVEEDLNGIKTHEINTEALKRLASGIGYDYNKDIHGGDAALLQKQYDIIQAGMNAVTAAAGVLPGTTNVGGTVAQGCTGKGCTVNAFMSSMAQCVIGGPPTPEVLTVLIKWAALEGGSVNNSYNYNLCNTGWKDGVNYTQSGSFPSYASFQDGVKAHCYTLLKGSASYGYGPIVSAMKSGDTTALASALWASQWCAGGHSCYGKNGKTLLDDPGSYGNSVLP